MTYKMIDMHIVRIQIKFIEYYLSIYLLILDLFFNFF